MPAPKPLLRCDYLVVESTYGNRLHKQEEPVLHLEQIINKTASRGGSVVIPAFAVGRTQNILYYLYQLRLSGAIGDIPIYLDSPMAINATNLYKHYSKGHRLSEKLCEKVCDVATYVRDVEESKILDQQPCPKIIISASGMATGGRILHHLKHYLTDSKHTIVFTGYQAGGTRGDRLLKGEKTIKIHGGQIPVRASIEVISNMSAHADYEELLTWFETLPAAPVKVYVTHGEKQASQSLCEKIEERYQWRVESPSYQQKEVL
jgi:metallo-beta-lactamase family protein